MPNTLEKTRQSLHRHFKLSTIAQLVAFSLIASGVVHLGLIWIQSAAWDGPVSLRKPALFGISAGLTVWSLAWVATKIRERSFSTLILNFTSVLLFLEVGLITLQYWRGVPSHFNRTSVFNANIESTMLGLILIAALGVLWFTIQTFWLKPVDAAYSIAIRGGMWLLTISCAIGVIVTVIGEYNLSNGASVERYGDAGVLKYPHGAAIHALQLLPIVAFLTSKIGVPRPAFSVLSVLISQGLLVVQAVWQTANGLGRLDLDLVGGALLISSLVFLLAPIAMLIFRLAWLAKSPSFFSQPTES